MSKIVYEDPLGTPIKITLLPPKFGPEPMSLELYDIAPDSAWKALGPVFIKADGKPAKLNDVIRFIGAPKSLIGRFLSKDLDAMRTAYGLLCLNGAVRSSLKRPKKARE